MDDVGAILSKVEGGDNEDSAFLIQFAWLDFADQCGFKVNEISEEFDRKFGKGSLAKLLGKASTIKEWLDMVATKKLIEHLRQVYPHWKG